MATVKGQRAEVGGSVNPERIVARLARLQQSVKRAKGDKAKDIKAEIKTHEAQLERLRKVLE